MRAGAAGAARACGHGAGRGRRARRPCPLRRNPAQPAMKRSPPAPDTKRLVKVSLDENTIGAASRDIEHERAIAIYDLIEENFFAPADHEGGPYRLNLGVAGN